MDNIPPARTILWWGLTLLAKRFLAADEMRQLAENSAWYSPAQNSIRDCQGQIDLLCELLHLHDLPQKPPEGARYVPLRSLFADLYYHARDESLKAVWLYPRPQWDQVAYPEEPRSSDDYRKTLRSWRRQLIEVLLRLPLESSCDRLLAVLERFAVHLSLSPLQSTTVSFHDAVRLAAAVASGLPPASADDTEVGRLLVADLSGIQNFVYQVSTKGALKMLRAKSFYLEMVCHHFAREIRENWPAPTTAANSLAVGGGKFYLWLPPHPEWEATERKFYAKINEWFLKYTDGAVHLAIRSVPVRRGDLQDFAPVWERLHEALKMAKRLPFAPWIEDGGKGARSLFHPRDAQEQCPACGKQVLRLARVYPGDADSPRYCHLCRSLVRLGGKLGKDYALVVGLDQPPREIGSFALPRLRYKERRPLYYLVAADEASLDRVLETCSAGAAGKGAEGAGAAPGDEARAAPDPANFVVRYRVNDLDGFIASAKDTGHLLVERYVFTNADGEPADFSELAGHALGAGRLATLRMDVDYLSLLTAQLFSAAHGSTTPGTSLGLFIAFSRSLSYFFKYYLNLIAEGKGQLTKAGKPAAPYQLVSQIPWGERQGYCVAVVYAGGDDLYLLGAWQDVTALAVELETCFKRYVCNHRDLSVSAGIVLHHDNFPVYLAARQSGKALSLAKGNTSPCDPQCSGGDLLECPLFSPTETRKKRAPVCLRKASLAPFYSAQLERLSKSLEEEYDHFADEQLRQRIALTLRWQEWRANVLTPWERLSNKQLVTVVDAGRLQLNFPRSVLSKLFSIVQRWRHNVAGILYVPHLVYEEKRILGSFEKPEQVALFSKILDDYKAYRNYKMKYLHLPLMMLELAIREKSKTQQARGDEQ